MAALLAGLAISPPLLAGDSKQACPETSEPDLVLQLPPLGDVKLWTYVEPKDEARSIAVLCDGQGHLLRRLEIQRGMSGEIKARKYDVPGWPSPILAIASTRLRGDGITVDEMLLTVSGKQLTEVLPWRRLDFADALCLRTSPDSHLSVDLFESVTGNECFLCWPKRFQVTTYSWNGSELTRQSKQTTHRKHKDWRSALDELKLSCPAEVLQATAEQD